VYDERDVPDSEKKGVVLGMSMTEKQGGSDVRANTTHATLLDHAIVCKYTSFIFVVIEPRK
jgi:alkylation response protein AidB-like acyl-CoA dehydrogenase